MEKIKEKIKNITIKQWHIAIIVIGILFVGAGAFHSNMWFDEAYSVGMARQSFADIWNFGGYDVHPVLYYWLLHIIYLIAGESIVLYRLFSVIPVAIVIILGYTHIRKDFGEKAGIIFSFLAAFLPEMAVYAVEVRMYSWAMLTVTVLAIYAYRLAKEDNTKNWIIFGLSSIASIFLHYYGLMAAGLINVVLLIHLIRNKRKKGLIFILAFGIIQALAYLPWMLYLATQLKHVSNGFWIGFTFPKTLMELGSSQLSGYIRTTDYKELLVPTVLALELYGYMIYKTYKLSKEKQDMKPFKWAVGMYFAVIVASLAITFILTSSILYYRYLFCIMGLYIFAISFILSKEKNKVIVTTILTVILGLGIFYNVWMIKDNYDISNSEPIKYMEENIKDTDTVVYTDCGVGSVAANHCIDSQVYFVNEANWGVQEAYRAFGPNYDTVINREFMEKCSDRIWVIDNVWGNAPKDLFGDETKYKIVSEEKFVTKYHDYSWKITLVEKIK